MPFAGFFGDTRVRAVALQVLAFVGVVALMVVPLQMCLIPLLKWISNKSWYSPLQGGIPAVWLAHAIFAMPLTIFLLTNFIGSLPREVMEAARVDGAAHMLSLIHISEPTRPY